MCVHVPVCENCALFCATLAGTRWSSPPPKPWKLDLRRNTFINMNKIEPL